MESREYIEQKAHTRLHSKNYPTECFAGGCYKPATKIYPKGNGFFRVLANNNDSDLVNRFCVLCPEHQYLMDGPEDSWQGRYENVLKHRREARAEGKRQKALDVGGTPMTVRIATEEELNEITDQINAKTRRNLYYEEFDKLPSWVKQKEEANEASE